MQHVSNKTPLDRIGGGGLYALVGARIWLDAPMLRILVEDGTQDTSESADQFPEQLREELNALGTEMWAWKSGKVLKASIDYCGTERT